MKSSDSYLQLVEGGSAPRKFSRDNKDEAEQLICRTCESDVGVASSVWVKAILSPMAQGGKVEGGTEVLVCALCLSRGKVTRAT